MRINKAMFNLKRSLNLAAFATVFFALQSAKLLRNNINLPEDVVDNFLDGSGNLQNQTVLTLFDLQSPDSIDYVKTLDEPSDSQVRFTLWMQVKGIPPVNEAVPLMVGSFPSNETDQFLQRLPVLARFCNSDTCPMSRNNPEQATLEEVYQQYYNWTWLIFGTINGSLPQSAQVENVCVSYYSESLGTDIVMKASFRKDECEGLSCPRYCSSPSYFYDTEDGLCKLQSSSPSPAGPCSCYSTCFTPSTVHSGIFPWRSKRQQAEFTPSPNGKQANQECHRRWERDREGDKFLFEKRFSCSNKALDTCSQIGSWSHHLFFFPEAKLIFCGIPKAGITEWLKFLRFTRGAADFLSYPHVKMDREPFLLSSLEPEKAKDMLTDPAWTKAVFFRDPAERLLSAYLDKVVGDRYTQMVFRIGVDEDPKPILSFAEFVKLVTSNNETTCGKSRGINACQDPHFKPQMMTCGLDQLLPYFDMIGNLKFVSDHTRLLLERVGLWEHFGALYDDGHNNARYTKRAHVRFSPECAVPTPQRPSNYSIPGFNQGGTSEIQGYAHATGAKKRMEDFYTPELMDRVREAYYMDYQVWDQIRDLPQMTSGLDLDVVKEYCSDSRLDDT